LEYDEVDKKILALLSGNSRLSVRKISKMIDSSPPTVSRRIRRLEERGIIKGYVSIIEDEELGYDCRALMLIKVSGNSDPEKIIDEMKSNDRICNLYTTVGNYDIISTATCPKLNDLSEFIDGIRKINGIAWIDSVLITSRVKVLKKILTEEP
jgi:Lrp/AsnC family leucine-responsive transcriptional regulator